MSLIMGPAFAQTLNAVSALLTIPAIQKIWSELTELTEEGGIEPAHFVRV